MKRNIWFLMAVMLIPAFIITSCKKDSEEEETPANTAPTASFTVNPETGNNQTVFNVDASGSSDQQTAAADLEVRWDWNDDGTWDTQYSKTKTASTTYGTAQSYTIRLEVKDGGGLTGTTTKQVTVTSGGGNLPPDPATNPIPANAAVDVAINAGLQWTGSDPEQDPLTYDVYFGTAASPPLIAEGITSNNYAPVTLEYNTTYYWMIKSKDNNQSTDGPIWSFTTGSQVFGCGDDITDPRDGKIYGTVQIGEQCWMSQNMNIGMRINGTQNMSDDGTIEKYCYDDSDANCDAFGALYQWSEMVQYAAGEVQGICPEGWHIPALEEWEALEIELGMPEEQATAASGWQGTYEGNALKVGGSTGFNALMGGNRSTSGGFTLGGLATAFWTGTQSTTYNARARTLDDDHGGINHTNYNKEYGHAVRCLKD